MYEAGWGNAIATLCGLHRRVRDFARALTRVVLLIRGGARDPNEAREGIQRCSLNSPCGKSPRRNSREYGPANNTANDWTFAWCFASNLWPRRRVDSQICVALLFYGAIEHIIVFTRMTLGGQKAVCGWLRVWGERRSFTMTI